MLRCGMPKKRKVFACMGIDINEIRKEYSRTHSVVGIYNNLMKAQRKNAT